MCDCAATIEKLKRQLEEQSAMHNLVIRQMALQMETKRAAFNHEMNDRKQRRVNARYVGYITRRMREAGVVLTLLFLCSCATKPAVNRRAPVVGIHKQLVTTTAPAPVPTWKPYLSLAQVNGGVDMTAHTAGTPIGSQVKLWWTPTMNPPAWVVLTNWVYNGPTDIHWPKQPITKQAAYFKLEITTP